MGSLSAVKSFTEGWAPSYMSTKHRVHVREVNQGGNYMLTAGPQAAQAIWTGRIASRLAGLAPGPLGGIARVFSVAFSPLVSIPTCWVAASVKEGFYESSVKVDAKGTTKYYELGKQVEAPIEPTVSLTLEDGILRHFTLGKDVTHTVKNSVAIEEGGKKKYFSYTEIYRPDQINKDDKVMEINGKKVQVRLSWGEVTEDVLNSVEIAVNGEQRYFKLGNEVSEPAYGTVEVGDSWNRKYYLLGKEISAPTEQCVKIKTPDQVLHYELGKEQPRPTEKTRTFVINGKSRHFLSAKQVSSPTSGLAEWVNKIRWIPFKMPQHLGIRAVKVLNFLAERISSIVRIVTILAGAALAALGHYFMAAGVLLAVIYEWLDHDLGVIPRKVSLFVERWMPTISLVGLLLVGSTLSKVFAAVSLAMYNPSLNRFLHQKLDRIYRTYVLGGLVSSLVNFASRKSVQRGGREVSEKDRKDLEEKIRRVPLLEDCEAPLVERKKLSFQEINKILEGKEEDYEIDPAHCTKPVERLVKWPENRDFNLLLKLWNEREEKWVGDQLYGMMLKRLVDDKRFIIFLQKRFPEVKRFRYESNWRKDYEENTKICDALRTSHREQIEKYIETLAREKKQTKHQFVAQWVKEQLQVFVKKLSGKKPIEGAQIHLEEAIQNTAKILPFLMKSETSEIEREDALIKLAIEGGDYCALAMRRASREVLEGFTEPTELKMEGPLDGRQIRLGLQKVRQHLIQRLFNDVAEGLRQKEAFQDTAEDVHLYHRVDLMMKRGFYPLADHEERDFGLNDLINLETIGLLARTALWELYPKAIEQGMNVLSAFQSTGRNKFLDYLRSWVEKNEAISAQQKKTLLEGTLSDSRDNLADLDLYPKIHRLVLMIHGIKREKKKVA